MPTERIHKKRKISPRPPARSPGTGKGKEHHHGSDDTETATIPAAKLLALRTRRSRRWAEAMIEKTGILADGREVPYAGHGIPETAKLEWKSPTAESPVIPGFGRVPKVGSDIRVLMYHKPPGKICASVASAGSRSVFRDLPEDQHWLQVGRLDINSEGLLLWTNNGELSYRLMHPKYRLDREYMVRVLTGNQSPSVLARLEKKLRQGVMLEDGMAKFDDLVPSKRQSGGVNRWFYVTVRSGRKRMVRRLWESQGVKVSRLIRVRYANVFLPADLKFGTARLLTVADRKKLLATVGMKDEIKSDAF